MSLAKACRAESVPIRYSTIRAAIAFWVLRVRKLGEDAGSDLLAQLAREMKEMLELQFGDGEPDALPAKGPDSALLRFVEASKEYIEELAEFCRKYIDEIEKGLGPSPVAGSIESIMKEYSNTTDVEGATRWLHEAQRYMLAQIAARDDGVRLHLLEYAKSLKDLEEALRRGQGQDHDETDDLLSDAESVE